MVAIRKTKDTEVYHQRGEPMSIDDIEEFCAKAREAGFDGDDHPKSGGCLIEGMTLRRTEDTA